MYSRAASCEQRLEALQLNDTGMRLTRSGAQGLGLTFLKENRVSLCRFYSPMSKTRARAGALTQPIKREAENCTNRRPEPLVSSKDYGFRLGPCTRAIPQALLRTHKPCKVHTTLWDTGHKIKPSENLQA